jgi:hypothetical protein
MADSQRKISRMGWFYGCLYFSEFRFFVILRLDRRIQNRLRPMDKKPFFQPPERFLDGPVKPDHDEKKIAYFIGPAKHPFKGKRINTINRTKVIGKNIMNQLQL